MTTHSRLTRNMQEGDTISLDGGRIVFTLQRRSGRTARVSLDLADEVRIDKPTAEQVAAAEARKPPEFGGYL